VSQSHLTFFEHLDELRKRLLFSVAAVAAASLGAFFFADRILEFLINPGNFRMGALYFFYPAEAFLAKINVALLTGFVLASPIVAGQAWLFISPGLHENERKAITPLILMTSFLFLAGVMFSFFLVLPFALDFFMGMRTEFLQPMVSVGKYVSFVSSMLLIFGLAFNLPVFVMGLASTGLLNTRVLNHYQRHAVVLIFILAAILTPGPDIASQLLLALPLLALFELSVIGAFLIERARRRRP
jgi:sec-independent protein translocase protein TatC